MKQKIFTFARKLITHAILASYLLMSIAQSYAMENSAMEEAEYVSKSGLCHKIIGSVQEEKWGQEESSDDLEICQSKRFESIFDGKTSEESHSSIRSTPTNGYEGIDELPNSRNETPTQALFKAIEVTPPHKNLSDKCSRSRTPENNSNRTTPQSKWSDDENVRSNAGTPTYDVLNKSQHSKSTHPPKFPDMPDIENGKESILLSVVIPEKPIHVLQRLEECSESPNSLVSPVSAKSDTLDEEKTEDKNELPNREPLPSDNVIYYAKAGISGASSLVGSIGLAILAYNLGARKNQEIAYILLIDSLIANAILFHKNNMGLTMNDIPYERSKSLSQNAYTCSSCLLKFTAAGISSIPAAYVSGIVTNDISPALSSAVYAFNFINTLLLFHKAQIAFVNYFDELLKLRKTENEKIWFYKSRLEEVAALSRDEIHVLYDKFKEAEEPESQRIPDDKFENLMKQIKLTESDTQKQFWIKEGAGIAFGPGLSGIFGGIYIFKVGFTLYNLFLQKINSELSPKDIITLTYVGALILSIVQNTVQLKLHGSRPVGSAVTSYACLMFYTT